MGLWGLTTADEDKPKFLPVDSNAAGSSGARENIIASKSGWALAPGLAASGNDNTDAEPEILVCVKNIAEAMGNASIIGIDWTDATVAVTGLVDITVTFDEAVDITNKDSGSFRELLPAGGIQSMSITASGVFTDSTAETTLRSAYGTSTFKSYNVIVPDLGTYAGSFMIASLEYSGEYNGEATYSVTLESSGSITFSAA